MVPETLRSMYRARFHSSLSSHLVSGTHQTLRELQEPPSCVGRVSGAYIMSAGRDPVLHIFGGPPRLERGFPNQVPTIEQVSDYLTEMGFG